MHLIYFIYNFLSWEFQSLVKFLHVLQKFMNILLKIRGVFYEPGVKGGILYKFSPQGVDRDQNKWFLT